MTPFPPHNQVQLLPESFKGVEAMIRDGCMSAICAYLTGSASIADVGDWLVLAEQSIRECQEHIAEAARCQNS